MKVKTRHALWGSVACLLATLACSQAPTAAPPAPDTHDADIQAIKETEAAWSKTALAKDAEKFTGYYADDASLLLADMPMVEGKEAIGKTVKEMMGDPNFSLSFQGSRFDVAKSGDLGYSHGSYTMTVTNPKTKKAVTDKGKYLTVFRKQADGTWKAAQDMVNSDGAAPSK